MKKVFIYFVLLGTLIFSQQTPLQKSGYAKVTSHSELSRFIEESSGNSTLIRSEVIAKSGEGRELYAVYFSKNGFAKDTSKIKVLIFCQQHGNEQSGKEGGLLLIQELLKPENLYLFDKIDLALVPQVNPDGSEKNERRNKNGMDLNRNHLILTEPETIALHKLFDKYLFEVTMDVHEYFPFGEEWKEFGYRANSDIKVGVTTNINVSGKIRELSKKGYLPFIKEHLNKNKISFSEYSPGGPPEKDYIRHSTFDINDGRQSFGIQNTFSIIQEGLNGTDRLLQNIQHRAEGQMRGMQGLLMFVNDKKGEIKNLVKEERKKLTKNEVSKKVGIQLDHFPDGSKLELPLFSYSSERDTVITVTNYRPVVKALYEVERPIGYLVLREFKDVVEWADKQGIKYYDYSKGKKEKYEQYYIVEIDSIDFEGDIVANPVVEIRNIQSELPGGDYIFIPMNQLKNNLIVIALEPKSELGLVTYKNFEHLLRKKENYPILRVVN